MYLFISLQLLLTVFLFKDIYDLLPFISSSLVTVAAFQKNDLLLRQVMMLASMVLISYNVLIFTPVGVLLEVVFLGSNIVGYWRYYGRKKGFFSI
jgi:Bacterial inner membrane protein